MTDGAKVTKTTGFRVRHGMGWRGETIDSFSFKE